MEVRFSTICLHFHISASFWAFLWPGLRNKYSSMSLATWSGAAFIHLSLWQVQLVQVHLGWSHLLKSVSSREAEFSLVRYWRCNFLHPQPPDSCSERAEHQRSDVVLSDMLTGQEPILPHWTGRAYVCSFSLRLQQDEGVSPSVAGNVLDPLALYRITEPLEASLETIKSSSTMLKEGELEWIPRAMSSWVMSISENGDSTSCLGNLLQCLCTFTMKRKNLTTTQTFSCVQMESA